MPDVRYENFDLTVQREEQGYRVRVDSPVGQATELFSVPFSALELENFILTTTPGRRSVRRIDTPEVAAAKKFGERLFSAVFTGEVSGLFHSALRDVYQGESRLRIRLRLTDVPELAYLPWEYLYNSSLNRFLALDDDTALVRYLELPERVRPVAVTLPLKVLVAISNPNDYPRLDIDQEWANLNDALGGLKRDGLLELDLLEDAALPLLRKQLSREQYHIFHFIGHGGFDRQTEEGVLVLKDEYGRGRLVSGQQLGWLMHNHKTLALVVLNACEGARADSTDVFAGTAQSLMQQGIPAVVAMQREITDDAAKTFAHAFYSTVADGRPVEAAMTETRLAIFAEGHGLEWATPVLYMRAPDGKVFDLQAPISTVAPSTRSIDERAAAARVEAPVAPAVPAAAAAPEETPAETPAAAMDTGRHIEQSVQEAAERAALGSIEPALEQEMRKELEKIAPQAESHPADVKSAAAARPAGARGRTWLWLLVAGLVAVAIVVGLLLSGVFTSAPAEQASQTPTETSPPAVAALPISTTNLVFDSEIAPPEGLLKQTQVVKLAGSQDEQVLAVWYYEGRQSASGSEAHIYIADSSGFIDNWGIDGYDKTHTQMIVYPAGDVIAVAGKGQVDFEHLSGQMRSTTVLSDVLSLAISPNGQTMAVGYRGGWVDVWDADKAVEGSDYLLFNLNAHAGDVESVAFSPDSRLLATTEYGATKVWDVLSRSQKYVINHDLGFGSGETETAFSHDGKSLAVCSGAVQCGFWRVDDGSSIGTLEDQSAITKKMGKVLAVGWSADDQTFATGWESGQILLWKDGKLESALQADLEGARATAMIFAKDLTRVGMGLSDGNIKVWRVP